MCKEEYSATRGETGWRSSCISLFEKRMCEGNQLTNKGIGYEFYYSGQARWHPRTI